MGLYADGSSWIDVIPYLQRAGLNVTVVQNPLTSLADDVAATRRVLASASATASTGNGGIATQTQSQATGRGSTASTGGGGAMDPLWVALLFALASLAAIVRTRERS
jgi:hypothetical protein